MLHLKYENSETLGNSEETNSLNSLPNKLNTKQYIHIILDISL